MSDLVSDLEDINIYMGYGNLKKRVNLYVAAYHFMNYYRPKDWNIFSDRYYGLELGADYTFSQFSRVEVFSKAFRLDRKYIYDESNKTASLWAMDNRISWVFDNSLWGYTGPVRVQEENLPFNMFRMWILILPHLQLLKVI
jgi:hypothetical protein